ncbi:MAG: autotransporter domain-containing protein, partial [Brevundimonas sp.]
AGQFTSTGGPLTKSGTGTTTLSGDSSSFSGPLNVYNGGLIVTSALGSVDGYIADPTLTHTNPFMTVTGRNANWAIIGNLNVRGGGATALAIENGAQISNNFGEIGATGVTAATVTVTGAGSLWTNRTALIVGNGATTSKNGALRILDGGKVTSLDGYIASGNGTGATGFIEVSGTGSSWTNTGNLRIGDLGGNGTLIISDGGYVSSNLTQIGTMGNGVGIANLTGTGSRWDVTGNLDIGFGILFNYGSGTVNISDGALLNVGINGTGTIYLAKDGLFPGMGTTGVLNIGAGTDNAADALAAGILQAGELRLGAGSATLRFNHTDTSYLFNTKLIGTSSTDVIKQVAGTTIFTADNTGYTAQTQVSGGTLIVRGKHAGTAAVTGGALQFGDASGGQNSILNSITVSGNGSALGVYGQGTATVIGAVDLQDNTTLSIHAGTNTPALTAGNMAIGNGTAFNLSGIGSASQLPLTLISTTNGISGDFANVTIGGFNGPVDYMTLNTRKSADGLNYLADYSLSWTASNNLAHGTFTLSRATDNFNLDVALGDQAANADWDGTSLTKAGAGTLILSADNTYTGGTTISRGTLQLGDGGSTGSVLGNIANNGTLSINRSNALTLDGIISGNGALVQNGTGTLTLNGTNTYNGGTTIRSGEISIAQDSALGSGALMLDGGLLSVTNSFNFSNLVNLAQNGRLNVASGQTLGLTGVVTGSGALVLDGVGTLTLTGTNTYSGGTVIENGTLSVSQDANLGQADGALSFKGGGLQITGTGFASTNRNITLDINTGGLDIVEAGHSFTVNGNIAGPGNVLKRGAGTLVLTGQNSYGRLRIENGKVVANSASLGSIADLAFASSALSLSDTGNGLYAGTVTGAGKLSLDGFGTVLLTGNSSTFNGTTALNSGRLLVGNSAGQGSLGGTFNVLSGATLGGSGTIGSGSTVTIASGGTLSPGNSIGTLNVYGHLDLQAGSLLNMELGRPGSSQNTPGTSDRVNVAGDLTLNGTLNLTQSGNAADGDYSFGYYRLMTYGGTLNGNGLTIGQSPALAGGASSQIIAGNGNVDLFVSAIGDDALQHWQGGDGVWSASNSQWLNQNGSTAANWAGNHAVFRNPDAATSGGTITLVGAQSFKGLQFVDNGYRLEGTGSLVTDSAGSEIRVLADSATIATTITGTGGLTKTQGGTLILTGTNTYSGGTTIKDGVISVTQNVNLGQANGALAFDGGALQINGTDFGSLDRNISLGTNGGALDLVEANHSLTLNGTITGAGTLLKQGAGTLVLTGQNSFGGISIEEGKLIARTASLANQVDLADASTVLSLTDTGNSHYAGILSGSGQFNMDGKGTVLLSGDSSAFDGTTTLNSGTLLVGNGAGQGALGGSFNVLNGATLGGSGTIGSGAGSLVTIASGATLSPGNSIGTLSINGDLLIQKGARFVVEVTPGGSTSDLVRVNGTATLGGGTVAHIGANGNYDLRSTYTILSATSLSGTFDAVTSDFAFLTPTLTYDNTRVTLDLKRNDLEFASAAQGRNQVRTARAIESIGFNTGHDVYDTIAQMADDKTAIRSAFDQLSGELHASARAIQIEDSRFVRHAANDRLRSAFGQAGSSDAPVLAYAANGSQVAVDATYDGAAFWAQSFGSWGSFDNDANSIELERQMGGALLGGDVRLKDWRLGLIAGYSQSEVKAERQKATSDNTTLGMYAGGQWGKLALRAGLAQSWHDIETQRSVLITGLSDHLQAEYSATTRQAFVETGYALISREKEQLEAFANLAQVRASSDAFSEDGDAAALDIGQTDADVTFATLGLRAARQIAMGETSGTLRATAGWRYASGDTATQNLQAFSAGDAFTITGAPIAKNAAVIETGLDVRFNANTTFGLTYTGQFSNSAQDHGFNARLSINF